MEKILEGNKSYRAVFLIAMGGLFVALLTVLLIIWLAFVPRRTADITQPIVVNKNPVESGSVIDYTVELCRYTSGEAIVQRTLVSLGSSEKLIVPLGTTVSKQPLGCGKFQSTNALIPTGTPSGEYYVEFGVCYQTTILQRQCGKLFSEPFFVINPRDKDNPEVQARAEAQRSRVEQERETAPSKQSPISNTKNPPNASPQQPVPTTQAEEDVILEVNPNTGIVPIELPTVKITQ